MKIATLALIASIFGASMLAACAEDFPDGPVGAYADVGYTGFYDDYYGPFSGGYWGPEGAFYYSDGHRFHRDTAGHFRRQGGAGFHPIQGHAPPARGGGGPSRHDHR